MWLKNFFYLKKNIRQNFNIKYYSIFTIYLFLFIYYFDKQTYPSKIRDANVY